MFGLGLGGLGIGGIRASGGGVSLPSGAVAVWDASQLSSLYQDSTGTTPVTAAGQLVGRWADLSGNGYYAAQATAPARPLFTPDNDGNFLAFDGADDALTVSGLPDLGSACTIGYVTRSEVRLLEDQAVSSTYTLPGDGDLAGAFLFDRALTVAEKVQAIRWLASLVDGVNYGAEIDRLALIAINAVDVFVYDTSKDSDGGAWRTGAVAQASSWYNEPLNTATRGARREFPAVAVIVAEASKITIYDGDDPTLPMWMVFNPTNLSGGRDWWRNSRAASSVAALNGFVCIGKGSAGASYDGLSYLNFPDDSAGRYYKFGNHGTISPLTAVVDTEVSGSLPEIVDTVINDVAMTVLPDAPIDPATGLPVPTIAVATAGGVSVIKDDGTVVDPTVRQTRTVAFDADGSVLIATDHISGVIGWQFLRSAPPYTTSVVEYGFASSSDVELFSTAAGKGGSLRAVKSGVSELAFFNVGLPTKYFGLTKCAENGVDTNKSMVAYTTSTYNTGWMPGDIKGAFLSSTDTASLVGATVENSEFTGTGVTDGWTIQATATNNNGVDQLNVTTGASSNVAADKTITGLTTGAWYKVQMTRISTGKNSAVFAGTSGSAYGTIGVAELTFKATATTQPLQIRSGGASENIIIDNISVKLADADRSVNNKGLIVNGTVTRNPVASGAELVAYSGFSASNYLEQPYNPDLPAGDQDICVMGWVKPGPTISGGIVDFGENAAQKRRLLYVNASGDLMWNTASSQVAATGVLKPDIWTQVCATHQAGGAINIYANGQRAAVGSMPRAPQTAQNPLLVGVFRSSSLAAFLGSIALLRISATIPTSDQIRRIYEDEKVLFQENAACTLYGTSDAVTALAHDPDTGLLHVGTSAGRSVFEGLRRVNHTTTSISTCISAAGGLVVEK